MNLPTLRDYQNDGTRWTCRSLNAGKNPLLVMPTGTGKSKTSVMIAHYLLQIGHRILILVPQDIILEQLLIDYYPLDPGYVNDEGVVGKNKKIYIAMTKSFNNLLPFLPEKFLKSFSIIITDETQFSPADTWSEIYFHEFLKQCQRVGLTATPNRLDNKPLNEFYDCMYEPIKMSEAIKRGYLCEPIIILPYQYKEHVPEGINFDINEQKLHIENKHIIGNPVEIYNDIFDGLPVIIPTTNKEHATEIVDLFNDAGWNAVFISGFTRKKDRKKIIREVRSGKINQLVVVGVGIYGMDIPELAGIIWMRFTESLTIYMQLNGRPMRPNGVTGKNKYIYVDMVGNIIIHGRPDIDRHWSLENEYKPGQHLTDPDVPKMKICPICSVMNAESNINCHICGYEFGTDIPVGNQRRLPKIVDGELVFLDESDRKIAALRREKQAIIEETSKNQPEEQPEEAEPANLDKMDMLKNGLESRTGVFAETLKKFL